MSSPHLQNKKYIICVSSYFLTLVSHSVHIHIVAHFQKAHTSHANLYALLVNEVIVFVRVLRHMTQDRTYLSFMPLTFCPPNRNTLFDLSQQRLVSSLAKQNCKNKMPLQMYMWRSKWWHLIQTHANTFAYWNCAGAHNIVVCKDWRHRTCVPTQVLCRRRAQNDKWMGFDVSRESSSCGEFKEGTIATVYI